MLLKTFRTVSRITCKGNINVLSVLPTRKYVGPISSDITEEREKDEEEKYFRKRDRELMLKLAEKLAAEQKQQIKEHVVELRKETESTAKKHADEILSQVKSKEKEQQETIEQLRREVENLRKAVEKLAKK